MPIFTKSSIKELLSKTILRNITLLLILSATLIAFNEGAQAYIIEVLYGGNCRDGHVDARANCSVMAFCEFTDPEPVIYANGFSDLRCPSLLTPVYNFAQTDGVEGGSQVSANVLATTQPWGHIRGIGAAFSGCNRVFFFYSDDRPEACTAPEPLPPGVCWNTGAMNKCLTMGFDWDDYTCSCAGGCLGGSCSPVIIDTAGDGYSLTSADNGVNFDLSALGTPVRLGWTSPNSDDAFLVLDRNGNGTIDNGSELFGNFTAQPEAPPDERNGFRALGVYDRQERGGNGDGVIDNRDAIFARLRLWQDSNHNGVSEPEELRKLPELNVNVLHVNYKESKKVDEFGNQFRFRAKVDDAAQSKVGRWAWDVFFVSK
jgi:hypothetical protein